MEHARSVVRAALSDQNLPGLSVAVGAGGAVAWAEGFGWADIKHRCPVTPDMRFRMGTGSTLLTAAGARMLMEQGKLKPDSPIQTVSAGDEDPRFRQRWQQPVDAVSAAIANAAGQPFLTFMQQQVYIPRFGTDPRRGVERMRPRNYSCFAGSMVFYSTPSDLVRCGLANNGGGDGQLVGGRVMSLLTLPDRGAVVAVMSNVTHADTSVLAQRVAAAFASQVSAGTRLCAPMISMQADEVRAFTMAALTALEAGFPQSGSPTRAVDRILGVPGK